jgi:hypothetical protein
MTGFRVCSVSSDVCAPRKVVMVEGDDLFGSRFDGCFTAQVELKKSWSMECVVITCYEPPPDYLNVDPR